MLKTLFFIICLMQATIAFGAVEMRWLSVASVLLDDGETQILFDPMFTRANFSHWLNLQKLKSDDPLRTTFLPGVKLDQVLFQIKASYPKLKVVKPNYGERIRIF